MSKSKSFFLDVLYFFGPVIFLSGLIGALMGVGAFKGYLIFSNVRSMDAKTVSQLPAGEAVLIEGRLAKDQPPRSINIVLWECSDGIADLWNPSNLIPVEWRQDVMIYPSLRLMLDDGVIITEQTPKLIVDGYTDHIDSCKALRDGSWITLVGRKTESGQVKPDYIFVGQRPQAIDYYQEQKNFFLVSLLLILIGALVSLGLIIPWIKGAKADPQAMYLPKPRMKRRAQRIRLDDER